MKTLKPTPAILLSALAGVSMLAMPGCRGDRSDKPPRQFFPDMDDSPKFTPQAENPFFPDGRSLRPPVPGTVAFGRHDFAEGTIPGQEPPQWLASFRQERMDLLKEDDAYYRGLQSVNPDGSLVFIDTIPIPVDQKLIARGQERFGIYCAICHGYYGRGEGMVGQRWVGQTVANLMDQRFMDPEEPTQRGSDGFLYHTAMNGVWDPTTGAQRMPAYNHALSAYDGWAIVAYIRVLQEAQQGDIQNVPEPRRAQLQAELARIPRMDPPGPGTTDQPPEQQPVITVPSGTPPISTPPQPPDQQQQPQNPAPEGTPR